MSLGFLRAYTRSDRKRQCESVTITLYRPSLRLTSGAGQLIRMQAEGLRAAARRCRSLAARGR